MMHHSLCLLATDNGLSNLAPIANITAVGALIVMVIWMVTRGFPRLLERSDGVHAASRGEFLAALDRQNESRSAAARSGHEVAARMELDLQAMAAELRRANDLRSQELRSVDTRRTASPMASA